MKYIHFIITGFGILLSGSCLKVQTCTCYNSDGTQAYTNTNRSYTASQKKSYQNYCKILDDDYKTYGGHCDLK